MNDRPNVLVLCTGNSCRSQIAEGYLKHFAGDRMNVFSAGTMPAERVHPLAIQVMREDGVDITSQRPKSVNAYLRTMPIRHMIVVCGGANAACPSTWPELQNRLYWPFDDPAGFTGAPAEIADEFRRVRDQIRAKILAWLDSNNKDAS